MPLFSPPEASKHVAGADSSESAYHYHSIHQVSRAAFEVAVQHVISCTLPLSSWSNGKSARSVTESNGQACYNSVRSRIHKLLHLFAVGLLFVPPRHIDAMANLPESS